MFDCSLTRYRTLLLCTLFCAATCKTCCKRNKRYESTAAGCTKTGGRKHCNPAIVTSLCVCVCVCAWGRIFIVCQVPGALCAAANFNREVSPFASFCFLFFICRPLLIACDAILLRTFLHFKPLTLVLEQKALRGLPYLKGGQIVSGVLTFYSKQNECLVK